MSKDIARLLSESAPGESVYNTSYVASLRNKWGKMLSGVKGEHKLNTMAVLFENQARHLSSLTEDTRSTNVGSFMKFVLIG